MDLSSFLNPYVLGSFVMGILIFYSQYFDIPISLLKPLPGPKGWPIFRIVPNLIWSKLDLFKFHKHLANTYGVIFSYLLFKRRVVVISDVELLEEAFNSRDLSARVPDHMREKIAKRKNVGIVSASGSTWDDHRPVVVKHLMKTANSKEWESALSREASKLTKAFASHNGSPFNFKRYVMCAVTNALCFSLFDKHYEIYDAELKQLVDTLSRARESTLATLLSTFLPSLNGIPLGPVKKYVSRNVQLVDLLNKLIEDCRLDTTPSSEKNNFVAHYVKEMHEQLRKEEADKISSLDKVNLLWTCFDLLTSGFDKTTQFVMGAIIHLAAHPEIQTRVQEELDSKIGRDRLPTLSDRPNLVYTEAVLLETRRLGPPPPLSLVHVALTDTKIGGYDIPQGSLVFPNTPYLSRAEYAWKDPATFHPERFINPEGSLIKRQELMTFGTGMRKCPGEEAASSAAFIIFSHLIHQFHLSIPDTSSVPINPDGGLSSWILRAGINVQAVGR